MVTGALIARLTHHLPAIDTRTRPDGKVVVQVGGGVPDLVIDPSTVAAVAPLTTPWGATAVRLAVSAAPGEGRITVMVLESDVAFAPDPEAGQARVMPGRLAHHVADLPPVVGYHEMTRYLAGGTGPDADGDRLLGLALAAAACMAGAERVGLDVAGLQADLGTLVDRAQRY
ncbi:MAG: hypothetical protein ACR2JF_18215 [Iamia sp.]